MELPLVINTKGKEELNVFKPTEGQPLADGDVLITVGEDLEKLEMPLLARIYNQANPGTNVNAFKPGTVIKFCLPSLIKIADKQAVPVKKETASKDIAGGQKSSEGETVEEKKEKKPAAPRKRDTPDKYRKGDKELAMREGSLRKTAYDTALNSPEKLDPKLRGVVSWLVRVGVLIREA